jgi:hypothetical protein
VNKPRRHLLGFPRRCARCRRVTLACSLLLIALTFSTSTVNAQSDYMTEFSEAGDVFSTFAHWEYLTQDGVHRTIEVYKYCEGQTCLLVPFDIRNHALLSNAQAVAFFENLVLQQMLPSQEIVSGTYSTDALNKGSITCDLTVPRFDIEAKALALQVVAEDVLPNLLPKNAAKIVQSMYDLGEGAGVVKSASVPILVLGAACVGGDFLENLATSSLVTCALLTSNLRQSLAYEGQYEDIMNCHSEALQKLKLARYSPDILTQHLETKARNSLEQWWADLSNWFARLTGSTRIQANITMSNYDKVVEQLSVIQTLNETYTGVSSVALSDFTIYKSRIELKVQEANVAIRNLDSSLSTLKSQLSGYTSLGGIYTKLLNLVQTPRYDFSAAIANQSLAMQSQLSARSLNSTYMFNSAINAAKSGIAYSAAAVNATEIEEAIPRQFQVSDGLVVLALAMLVLAFVAVIAVSRQQSYYV